MAVQTQIQVRRGTASSWTSTNPTLAAGEIGLETDTSKFKIGDGSSTWTSLAYYPTLGANTFTGAQTATSFIVTGSTVPANGMYLPAANTLGFASNSTERMRIDSAGQVGIGKTPAVTLDILGANVRLTPNTNVATNGFTFNGASSNALWATMQSYKTQIDGVTRFEVLGSGITSVGTSAGSAMMQIVNIGSNTANPVLVVKGAASQTGHLFDVMNSAGTELFWIDSSGTPRMQNPFILRADTSAEGGQINFARASDNASAWSLDVNGSTSTPSFRIIDNIAAASRLIIDSSGNVGIGATASTGISLLLRKVITGAVSSYGIVNDGVIQSDVTTNAYLYYSSAQTLNSNFNLTTIRHYHATQGTFANVSAGGTVTNQIGYNVDSSLTGATNNYAFSGNIASGTGRYNLYMGGTADNYINGNVGIGTTSPTAKLDVNGSFTSSNYFAAGKNKILNGDFSINQRAFTSTTSDGVFTFDRYKTAATGGTSTFTSQTFTPGAAPVAGYEAKNYLQLDSTGQSAAGDRTFIRNIMESARLLAGRTYTVSFWAKASSGTPSIALEPFVSFGTGGSPSASLDGSTLGNYKTALTTSWVRYSATFTMPSVSGKTFGTNNDDSTSMIFWTSAGSTYNSRTNSLGIQTTTIQIWGIQVELGSTATPFQTATGTIQGELAACQRYYFRKTFEAAAARFGSGYYNTTAIALINVPFPVPMRTRPTALEQSGTAADYTLTSSNSTTTTLSSVPTFFTSSQLEAITQCNTAGTLILGESAMLRNANTSAYLGWSAEL